MQDAGGRPVLKASNVGLRFGGINALDDVSFTVNPGEIVSIIGPNGAGKTCLLNCISGYYRPQTGSIVFKGHDLTRYSCHRIARTGISRTFQSPSLYAHMTGLDNLLMARYMHTRSGVADSLLFFGKSRREEISGRQAVEEIIDFAHIEELRNRPVTMMSFGQRKELELARALIMKPQLLLLDEPMSGLDDMMKEIVAELILKVQRTGVTVVLVEHDMEVVMGLSQSVVVLDFGRKIAEGPPGQVYQDAGVIEAYLGDASRAREIGITS